MLARAFLPLRAALLAGLLSAAAVPAHAAPAGPTCNQPGYEQLNGLLGDWTVSDHNGAVVGYDSIIHALGDCGFYEYYRSADASHRAFALLAYQPGAHSWHMSWLDDGGFLADFDGSPTATSPLSFAGYDYMTSHRRLQRVVWSVNPDRSLERIWSTSTDDGRHWTTTFEGVYRRTRG